MTAETARVKGAAVRNLAARVFVRRCALFVAFLLSGGNLLFPREPLLALLIGLGFLLVNPLNLMRRELGGIWLLLVVILAMAALSGGTLDFEATVIRYANFLGAIVLLAIYLDEPRHTMARDMIPLLMFFAAQAILTVLLARAIPQFFILFVAEGTLYHTIGLIFTYHDTVLIPGAFKRPDGFFFEPGVFQIYLNIYLYLALFAIRKPGHVLLATAGVLATQSTTGVLIAVMIMGAAYIRRLRVAGIHERLIVFILVPLLLIPVVMFAHANVSRKLSGELQGSSLAREYDFYTGLRIIEKYPITGIGFNHERYLDLAWRVGYSETTLPIEYVIQRTSSNGIVTLGYMVGIPLFLVFMLGMFRQRFFRDRLLMFGILFIAFLGEALALTPFFLAITFSGFLWSSSRSRDREAVYSLRAI